MKIDHDFREDDENAWAQIGKRSVTPQDDNVPASRGHFDDMDVRAYMMWASLLHDGPTPSLADFDLRSSDSFRDEGLLLKVDLAADDAAIVHLGRTLRTEFAIWAPCHRLSEAPWHPVLDGLVASCRKAIGQKAPLRVDASCANRNIDYWAMLLPFSSDGSRIDHVYCVVGWQEAEELVQAEAPAARLVLDPIPFTLCDDTLAFTPLHDDTLELTLDLAVADEHTDEHRDLVDSLNQARNGAQEAAEAHGRSRVALYRAIGLAHDFALSAREAPVDYERLLSEAGIVQQRSAMTALAKLVFGADYDKTRLAEIALVITHALEEGLHAGALAEQLQAWPGGLKGRIQALRAPAKIDVPPPVLGERVRKRLALAKPLADGELRLTPGEAVVLVARCAPDGSLEIVAQVEDERVSAPVFRHVAKQITRR